MMRFLTAGAWMIFGLAIFGLAACAGSDEVATVAEPVGPPSSLAVADDQPEAADDQSKADNGDARPDETDQMDQPVTAPTAPAEDELAADQPDASGFSVEAAMAMYENVNAAYGANLTAVVTRTPITTEQAERYALLLDPEFVERDVAAVADDLLVCSQELVELHTGEESPTFGHSVNHIAQHAIDDQTWALEVEITEQHNGVDQVPMRELAVVTSKGFGAAIRDFDLFSDDERSWPALDFLCGVPMTESAERLMQDLAEQHGIGQGQKFGTSYEMLDDSCDADGVSKSYVDDEYSYFDEFSDDWVIITKEQYDDPMLIPGLCIRTAEHNAQIEATQAAELEIGMAYFNSLPGADSPCDWFGTMYNDGDDYFALNEETGEWLRVTKEFYEARSGDAAATCS